MSNLSSTPGKSTFSTRNIVVFCIAWGIAALLFYLLFSLPNAAGEQPAWFLIGITFFELGAFIIAAVLCLRNYRSSQIISGRSVWLAIGLGMVSYALGNILFFLWGTVWGKDPAVSLGDFFYILSYVFLAWGMFQAVLPRRLNLESSQWMTVAGVGFLGVLLAVFVNFAVADSTALQPAGPGVIAPAMAQEAAPPDAPPPASAPSTLEVAPAPVETTASSSAPEWVVVLDAALEPYAGIVSLLYLIGDCVLVIIATTLLVAFWGGRFSQSWKLIAIAAFCLYIADMFFSYTVNSGSYVEGALWEVFWTFSALFFALGAAVEYEISTKSRRLSRRRRS